MGDQKKLAYAICDFLSRNIKNGTIKSDDAEGIEVAIQCIGEAFGVSYPENTELKAAANLEQVFNVFLKTQEQAQPKKKEKVVNKELAEDLKSQGNKLLATKNYAEAIVKYTEAIEADDTNAVYYSNRAAAYSQQGNHELAAQDAKQALKINPDYSKAYSRLGHAEYCLGNYQAAVDAYTKGSEMEPNNASIKQSLAAAQQKLGSVSRQAADPVGSSPFGGMGGMPDISQMMNDPNIMNMAAKMMSNPAVANMMSNPAIANMMNGARNGGGMPDIASLMNNPEIAQMASSLMSDPEAMNTLMSNPALANLAKNLPKE
ncbi:hypothetical protein HK103_000938 [Boothiomyces macroporosus]|uniref:STI1 domain-containing protein n=1 Tax=Boothiomyces macroporosus TaxID=261099 RepID=A0AAD5Y5B2_9FUNG|nr:hypothetical protein HK103_000938 [Boothiomyces macroporosus]